MAVVGNFIDRTGWTSNGRTALRRADNLHGEVYWIVRCERCGRVTAKRWRRLQDGNCICRNGGPRVVGPYVEPEPDEVVVDGIVAGHRFKGDLRFERRAALRILHQRRPDLNYRELAEWVEVHRRTVERLFGPGGSS